MLRNYIIVAIRDLWKSKYFSLLNILGLGISISVCLLVMMLINDSKNFDRFHPDTDQLFRVITKAVRKNGGLEPYATSPYPLSQLESKQSTLVKQWVPLINRFNGELVINDARFNFRGLATKPGFFEMFGFSLEAGKASDLNQSNVIILSKELTFKLFQDKNPIGQLIKWQDHDFPLQVIGVMKPFPGKTHLQFDALTSIQTIEDLTGKAAFGFNGNNWLDYYAGYHFIKLNKTSDKTSVEAELNSISKERYKSLDLETRDAGYQFELQSIKSITPGILLSNSMGKGLPSVLLIFLSVLGLIIISSAAFNHTNMSLAKAVGRVKEIGIRKVAGAERKHIFSQFIIEAIIISILSTVVGIVFLKLAIPFFNRLQFMQLFDISFKFSTSLLVWYFLFALVVGVFIGLVPSLIVSSIQALKAMQSKGNIGLLKKFSLRKGIIITQLSMTLLFFFIITTGFKQVNYSLQNSFGADKDYVVNLNLQGKDYSKVKTEFGKLKQIKSISGASILMGSYQDNSVDIKLEPGAEQTTVRDYFIDENFIKDFELNLIAGRAFEQDYALKNERTVIVNENFLNRFKLGKPSEAIGKPFYIDTQLISIQGVVRDFRFKPSEYAIEPLLLRYNPAQLNLLHLQMHRGTSPEEAATIVKSLWKTIDPYHPAQWSFYSEDIKRTYSDMKDIVWVVSVFALLAAIICLMGLLGIVAYTISTKRKEIAIRKVIGAELKSLSWILSKSYVSWLVIAVLISIPLATLINNLWLQQFSLRVSWSLMWFIPGLLILSISLILTVGIQIVNASQHNPLQALRNE
ncbi:MAG: ABC transporter permease [Saprospiraceae bacterium]